MVERGSAEEGQGAREAHPGGARQEGRRPSGDYCPIRDWRTAALGRSAPAARQGAQGEDGGSAEVNGAGRGQRAARLWLKRKSWTGRF